MEAARAEGAQTRRRPKQSPKLRRSSTWSCAPIKKCSTAPGQKWHPGRRRARHAGAAAQHHPPHHDQENCRSRRRNKGQRHRRLHDRGSQCRAPRRLDVSRRRAKSIFDRAKPHLMNMAKDAVYMGPLGCGNVTKLFKNMVTASEALIVYEALQIAKAAASITKPRSIS